MAQRQRRAIGDAKSLLGGTLVMTPLNAADGEIYAVAQGMIIAGGAIPSVKGMVAERKAKQQQEIAENLTARIAEQEDIEGL